jgi:hypothetical protein
VLLLALCLVAMVVSGCEILDTLTGVGDPFVEGGQEPSVIEEIFDATEAFIPWPWSILVGAVIGGGAVSYRRYRIEQRDK